LKGFENEKEMVVVFVVTKMMMSEGFKRLEEMMSKNEERGLGFVVPTAGRVRGPVIVRDSRCAIGKNWNFPWDSPPSMLILP
jgi:hypothetical protein